MKHLNITEHIESVVTSLNTVTSHN